MTEESGWGTTKGAGQAYGGNAGLAFCVMDFQAKLKNPARKALRTGRAGGSIPFVLIFLFFLYQDKKKAIAAAVEKIVGTQLIALNL